MTHSSTSVQELDSTILQLAILGKGILAADESHGTLTKRFASIQLECTPKTRQSYRGLLLGTPAIEAFISGTILFEETLEQCGPDGKLFPKLLIEKGITVGVKVDKGLIPLPFTQEWVTQGLDGLAERLMKYKSLGVRFAKWRAVFTIGSNLPSYLAMTTNAHALARYAAICQENGIVPIVEPELLMEGDHTLEQCALATKSTLHCVFSELLLHKVALEHIILKPNMVTSGTRCNPPASLENVAEATLKVLQHTVPVAVPSIHFLSGGQSPKLATAHLNTMNRALAPWLLSFSYGRALQEPVLKIWQGRSDRIEPAQAAFYHRAKLNALATRGHYQPELE